jgi:hypothetical protein
VSEQSLEQYGKGTTWSTSIATEGAEIVLPSAVYALPAGRIALRTFGSGFFQFPGVVQAIRFLTTDVRENRELREYFSEDRCAEMLTALKARLP